MLNKINDEQQSSKDSIKKNVSQHKNKDVFRIEEAGAFVETDITLICGKTKFPCHSKILSKRSGYFRKSLKATPSQKEWTITNLTFEMMQILLRFFYTSLIDNIEKYAAELLTVASIYEVPDLVEQCSEYLKGTLSVEDIGYVLFLAHTTGTESLENEAIDFALDHPGCLKEDTWINTYSELSSKIDCKLQEKKMKDKNGNEGLVCINDEEEATEKDDKKRASNSETWSIDVENSSEGAIDFDDVQYQIEMESIISNGMNQEPFNTHDEKDTEKDIAEDERMKDESSIVDVENSSKSNSAIRNENANTSAKYVNDRSREISIARAKVANIRARAAVESLRAKANHLKARAYQLRATRKAKTDKFQTSGASNRDDLSASISKQVAAMSLAADCSGNDILQNNTDRWDNSQNELAKYFCQNKVENSTASTTDIFSNLQNNQDRKKNDDCPLELAKYFCPNKDESTNNVETLLSTSKYFCKSKDKAASTVSIDDATKNLQNTPDNTGTTLNELAKYFNIDMDTHDNVKTDSSIEQVNYGVDGKTDSTASNASTGKSEKVTPTSTDKETANATSNVEASTGNSNTTSYAEDVVTVTSDIDTYTSTGNTANNTARNDSNLITYTIYTANLVIGSRMSHNSDDQANVYHVYYSIVPICIDGTDYLYAYYFYD